MLIVKSLPWPCAAQRFPISFLACNSKETACSFTHIHSVLQLNSKELLRRTTSYKDLKVEVNREENDHFRVAQLSTLHET